MIDGVDVQEEEEEEEEEDATARRGLGAVGAQGEGGADSARTRGLQADSSTEVKTDRRQAGV